MPGPWLWPLQDLFIVLSLQVREVQLLKGSSISSSGKGKMLSVQTRRVRPGKASEADSMALLQDRDPDIRLLRPVCASRVAVERMECQSGRLSGSP